MNKKGERENLGERKAMESRKEKLDETNKKLEIKKDAKRD